MTEVNGVTSVGWFQLAMRCGVVGVWALLLGAGQAPEVVDGRAAARQP